jgi:ABC-type nitrate/sulfonate/bicarbonate transport system permease component
MSISVATVSHHSEQLSRRGQGTLLRRIASINWLFWILSLLIVGGWQLGAVALNQPLILVPPTVIVRAGIEHWNDGVLLPHIITSAQEFFLGFIIAAVTGITFGLISGYWKWIGRATDPFIAMLYSVPVIALAPIFIMAMGLGILSKVIVVAIGGFFSIVLTTTAGVRAMEDAYIDLARVFGLGRVSTIVKVVIPYSVPYILSGLRVATGRGITAVLAAEIFGARSGLGLMIMNASAELDTPTVYLGVVIFAAAGAALTKLWYIAERHAAPWRNV